MRSLWGSVQGTEYSHPGAGTAEESQAVAGMLKKLSLDAERPAGVSEVVAMVKEGGIAALKARPPVPGCCLSAARCVCPLHGHWPTLPLLVYAVPSLPKQLIRTA